MKKRAAALCGAAVVVAGTFTAVPARASAPHAAPHDAPLTWKKCGTTDYPTLQCASLKVPLDHADPGGRSITLALSRVPHTAKKYQGPLLVNPGGPGGSGLTLAGYVASSLPRAVAAQYDVIGFDPRGVGASEPALNCAPGHFRPVRPGSVPAAPAAERAHLTRARSFADACGKKYARVLPYIDTRSTARDLDRIRRALGAPRISYFGYSYGTYLGAVYAGLYPDRVRRMVLDSVVDPTGVWYDNNLTQDMAFDDRHRAFMAWVARHDARYRLGTDPERVEDRWYAMRAALAEKPADGTVGAAELEDTFLPGGYYNGYWPHLAEAFAAYVNAEDPDPLVEAYETFGAVDAAGENGYSVYTAVQCRDTNWPRDWRQWRKDNWAVHARAPFMTWNNAWYNAPCAFWPTPSLRPVNVANDRLPPVLLFQATHDAATPYRGGAAVHRLLRGSRLVVEENGGNHGITLSGNTCLDRHLAAYLTDGTVPRGRDGADAVCAAQPDPRPLTAKAAGQSRGSTLHGLLGFRG
ncbi:alpha/beta hydrolase [Streptomyces chromofuscus]|uniref:Alpha/beta fold hydrolase n=1 Tax=Streptomyces chromofuscus TaxID=42881 RepID=A0A7M2T949_STRCW|nr:alpha/beta hydrolase [Streptomyces chromofuscus]QOV43931.1 alpha/beta fold hydrolase [Streptomyces chromofuscus]GGT20604.1 peptidase [Streptomyces chromofuscus]